MPTPHHPSPANREARTTKGSRPGFSQQRATRSGLLRELLAHDRVDCTAFRSALELSHDLAHHRADVIGSGADRRNDGRMDLIVAHRGREILAEHFDFTAFDGGEVGTVALVVHLDRLATPLDASA